MATKFSVQLLKITLTNPRTESKDYVAHAHAFAGSRDDDPVMKERGLPREVNFVPLRGMTICSMNFKELPYELPFFKLGAPVTSVVVTLMNSRKEVFGRCVVDNDTSASSGGSESGSVQSNSGGKVYSLRNTDTGEENGKCKLLINWGPSPEPDKTKTTSVTYSEAADVPNSPESDIYGEFARSVSNKAISDIGGESSNGDGDVQDTIDKFGEFLRERGRTEVDDDAVVEEVGSDNNDDGDKEISSDDDGNEHDTENNSNDDGYDGYGGYEDDFADKTADEREKTTHSLPEQKSSPIKNNLSAIKSKTGTLPTSTHTSEYENDAYSDDSDDCEFLRVGQMVVSKYQAKLYGIKKPSQNRKKKKEVVLSENMEAIACPVRRYEERSQKNVFGKESERINCTFKPAKSKAAINAMNNKDCGYDFLTEPNPEETAIPTFGKTDMFLKRMDNKERTRRKKLVKDYAEACYDDKIDKLRCPNCGNPQSYDEFVEKRMMCVNDFCGRKFNYVNEKEFLMGRFERRMQTSQKKAESILEKLRKEAEDGRESSRQKCTQKQRELMDKIGKEGGNFLIRMKKDTQDKKHKLKELEENDALRLNAACTFQPKLNIQNKFLKNRTKSAMEVDHDELRKQKGFAVSGSGGGDENRKPKKSQSRKMAVPKKAKKESVRAVSAATTRLAAAKKTKKKQGEKSQTIAGGEGGGAMRRKFEVLLED